VHVSNFRPVKRVTDVVEIFARLRERRSARLLMVGSGPDSSSAEALVRRLGLARYVLFLGAVPMVADLLAVSDLLLLPSERESFGLAALEAMASGVPVIGTASGGMPELVVSGEQGFLERVGDIAALAERAIQVLCDGELHQRMRRSARARAAECYETGQIVDIYENFYKTVLETDSPPEKANSAAALQARGEP
jgi:N-acetyl-alpha-D-glucosaminyl L-malate synthase BshA